MIHKEWNKYVDYKSIYKFNFEKDSYVFHKKEINNMVAAMQMVKKHMVAFKIQNKWMLPFINKHE